MAPKVALSTVLDRHASAGVILELPLSDPADLLCQLTPCGSFQFGNPIAQPPGHLVGMKFRNEEPVPTNEKGAVTELLYEGRRGADGDLKSLLAQLTLRTDIHFQEFARMGRIVDPPPRLKIGPTELSHSCSHRPMIA